MNKFDIIAKKLCMVIAASILFGTICIGNSAIVQADNARQSDLKAQTEHLLTDEFENAITYDNYIEKYTQEKHPNHIYQIDAADYIDVEGMQLKTFKNYEGMLGISVLTQESGSISWNVNIEEAGLYNMSALYYTYEGKSSDIQRSILIDGEIPFSEAASVEFYRVWGNQTTEKQVDNMGNDIRTRQVEIPCWNEVRAKDPNGYYTEDFEFYFSQGNHTVTFVSQREPMLLRSIQVVFAQESLGYEQVLKNNIESGATNAEIKEPIIVKAEDAQKKSSPMLYAVTDHSSPALEPYDPRYVKINTIGGESWSSSGQWLEWDIEVPVSGFYKIALNAKQNFVRGVPVKRKLTIDGKVPFKEAEQLDFMYESGWDVKALGGEEPYLFYFEAGTHQVRLDVVLGDLSKYVRQINEVLKNLNNIYHKIIMVTGTEPDAYRDYQLNKKMPDLSKELQSQHDLLAEVIGGLKSSGGKSSDKEAVLTTMLHQLEDIIPDTEKFISKLSDFKTNMGGLGTWLAQISNMPLQLDNIYLLSPEDELPKTNNSFFAKLIHEVQAIYYSFIVDYNSIGNAGGENQASQDITVWVGAGRDQANVLKSIIDETFTEQTGIHVNLMLVQMDTLLQATLAGQGPDVAMQVQNNVPMNYAMRGAVADLSQFSDFEEVTKRFHESALVPFQFEENCYALPETQTFPMMFYRKDILREQGLNVPQTWDDVKTSISTLSKNNMTFGLASTAASTGAGVAGAAPPPAVPEMSYGIFLYQNGGEFYSEDKSVSALDSDIAINAFKEWTRYYTDYTLEKEFDFANRFRTGEMPIGVADYSMYNTLQVSAPEIQGLWDFTQVPGTVRENGEIDHSVPCGGQSVVIMEQCKEKEAAWEFLKWWTSADTQIKFGREMEGLMGAAARYPTANVEALSMLPWPTEDYQSLMMQFENAKGIPEVPGGYFTSRNLNNAFYSVVVSKNLGSREALMDNVRFINDEIQYKRKEFGLDK